MNHVHTALALLALSSIAAARFSGSRGGVVPGSSDQGRAEPTDDAVTEYIAIEGCVELRVYWSTELEAAKERALAEAQRKSKLLLSVFAEAPRPVNVHEATFVEQPAAMYRSFESAYETQYAVGYRDDTPRISAFRAKNTYYHGFDERVDVSDPTLPMRPQISVVSKVVLYYASPAADSSRRQGDEDED